MGIFIFLRVKETLQLDGKLVGPINQIERLMGYYELRGKCNFVFATY
jgi:hypothetical protein